MIKYCPITGANIKYLLLSVAAGFAFLFIFEYIVHGIVLMDTYAQTPQLWRPIEQMSQYSGFMMLMQFLTVLLTAVIFSKHYEAKGLAEGLRFGALIGLLMGVMMAASFAWMPISGFLASAWFITGLAEGLGLGVIYALTYKDK
jgi:uncharacterized protein (DUF2062 family)